MRKIIILAIAVLLTCLLTSCALIGTGSGKETTTQIPSESKSSQNGGDDHEHVYGEWTVVKSATCTEYGEKERVCSCGEKEILSVDPAHTVVDDAAKEATCTQEGLSAGSHCSACNQVIVKQISVPKTPHHMKDNVCEDCDVKASEGLELEYDGYRKGYVVIGFGSCTDSVLIIPSEYNDRPVVSIGERALAGTAGPEYIYIPSTIKHIGSDAFNGSTNLKGIYFAGNVEIIMQDAFNHCTALQFINIPEKISLPSFSMSSRSYPFVGCDSFRTIVYGGTMDQWTEHQYTQRFDHTKTFTVYCTDGTIVISNSDETRTPNN